MAQNSASISQLMFRVPEDLHERLERQAEANHRSLNAEVVARLEASLAGSSTGSGGAGPGDNGLILGKQFSTEAQMRRMEELVEQSTTATDA